MLGISIYPENQSLSSIKKYIECAHNLGYKRIFSSLIELNSDNKDILIEKFENVISYARSLGFEFILDVNPFVFKYLNISYDNLEFFANLNCTGIRLDDIMSPKIIADLTHNKYNLQIEINASNSVYGIEQILEFEPIRRNLIACHNFYPQNLTGLDWDYFIKCSLNYKKHNIRTAAFVSADPKVAIYGPWPINEGICTVEKHRNLPIHTQAKLLFATNLIDDVLIGNSNASLFELEKLAKTNYDIIELDVTLNQNISKIEHDIIFDFDHFRRGDLTPKMIRSTMSRVVYQNYEIQVKNNDLNLDIGDIIICNSNFTRYKGELHLMLQPLLKDNRKNLVAKVATYDLELLNYITSWKRFKFVEVTKNQKV